MYKSISCVITLYAIQVSKVVKMMKMFSHINSGIVLDGLHLILNQKLKRKQSAKEQVNEHGLFFPISEKFFLNKY